MAEQSACASDNRLSPRLKFQPWRFSAVELRNIILRDCHSAAFLSSNASLLEFVKVKPIFASDTRYT